MLVIHCCGIGRNNEKNHGTSKVVKFPAENITAVLSYLENFKKLRIWTAGHISCIGDVVLNIN